ncbi:manganese efflux pump [Methanocalculus taiwanensis]|uniref:Putative manganese efflux pump MntP n=1 Tax=Methanocalculus taiwanensis TaxID=106207 RepID=A0ABD4TII4_9EURY|nr:manganese efflux pump [Methanocalculus taiwanensis]
MNDITLLIIAIAVAIDASAISIAAGATMKSHVLYYGVRAALFFGFFQGGMVLAGYLAGEAGSGLIASFDHWVAFILLVLIGGKMCYESFQEEADERKTGITGLFTLTLLAIATSIDALAVGATFAVLDVEIIPAALLIGAVTFAGSIAGIWTGRRFGCCLGNRIELIGGVILIIIGIRILVDGLFL